MIFRILETFLLEPFASEVFLRSLLPWLIEMELSPLCGRWGFRNCFTTLNFKDFLEKGRVPSSASENAGSLTAAVWNVLWLLAVWSFLKKNQSARKRVATLFLKTHLSIKCHDKCSQSSKKNALPFRCFSHWSIPTGQCPVTVCFCFSSVKTRRTSLAEPQVWSWNKWHVVSCKIRAFLNGFPQFVFSHVFRRTTFFKTW